MTEDVSAEPRKKFSAVQRLKIYESRRGVCALCGVKITDPKWIVEHLRPLAQGGANDMANLAPAHVACADAKTNGPTGDNANTAKAKRRKIAAVVGKTPPKRPLVSRGFTPAKERAKKPPPFEALGPPGLFRQYRESDDDA